MQRVQSEPIGVLNLFMLMRTEPRLGCFPGNSEAGNRCTGLRAAVLMGVDQLKLVASHAVSDALLRPCADRCAALVQGCGVATRLAGDEF